MHCRCDPPDAFIHSYAHWPSMHAGERQVDLVLSAAMMDLRAGAQHAKASHVYKLGYI